ncbi:hypothetical protein UA08_04990 [Talaromyces atroroseus]|uniref:Fe2OG dioxygenase domain-containing protein n=1 Tax=Talaromyces atroroseus TaxID=1441469 RepID=A0A225AE67_TALAT|nr:hypothetical protein UA08_04990 [Talaromyces atroroseus]OKL59532.1 hypothetical protein UA08_04990 [Talaromyces atroroseus]
MDISIPIQGPPFDLTLSHWDRLFPPTHSRRVLCFRLTPDADKYQIVNWLHIALHHTVQRVPFLAGSIVPFSSEEDNRPWLRNLSPNGSAYLDVKDLSGELNYDKLAATNFDPSLLDADKLCSLPRVAYVQDDPVDVCRFRANFIDGGLLLVVSIIHIVADGRGVSEIIRMFASNLRKAQAGKLGHPLERSTSTYISDRTLLVTGNIISGNIDRHAAWTASNFNAHANIADVETSCRTFRISVQALSTLKKTATATSDGADDWVSTGDAIAGLIWRSIMTARHRAGLLARDATTHLTQPVDCRSHLRLPEPYFGNTLYMTKASVPFSIFKDPEIGLCKAARMVRADIQAVTADEFRDLVGYAERTEKESHTRLGIIEDLPTGGLILTTHFKFAMHQIDFGPAFGDGHISAFRVPAKGSMAGAVYVLPQLPDGSCEFVVTESMSTLKYLLEDEFFARFAAEATQALDTNVNLVLPERNLRPAALPHNIFNSGNTKTLSTMLVSTIPAPHGGTIQIIQLARGSAKNAISPQLLHELNREIESIYDESKTNSTRALIIASAVDDVFCAGADLKERQAMTLKETHLFLASLRSAFSRLSHLPIPSIACLSGMALGGGLELALCCQLRVFSPNATVGLPETRLAIIPGAGGTYRLPALVGLSHAHDLILTGRKVPAQEAAGMGLCNRLVATDPNDSRETERLLTLDAGIELAQEITKGGPDAVRQAVRALQRTSEAAEIAAHSSLLRSTQYIEALQAFKEKRLPVFRVESQPEKARLPATGWNHMVRSMEKYQSVMSISLLTCFTMGMGVMFYRQARVSTGTVASCTSATLKQPKVAVKRHKSPSGEPFQLGSSHHIDKTRSIFEEMPSATPINPIVPTIDIAPFLLDPYSPSGQEVISSVRSACKKTGFFQVTGHGLPEELQRALFRAAARFFALSLDEKSKLDARTTIGRRGYDVLASQTYDAGVLPDLKEGFYVGHDVPLDDEKVLAKRFFMGPNVWPEETVLGADAFRDHVEAYFSAIHALALKVLDLVARTLPYYCPDIFADFTTGHTVAVLRMLHYPPTPPQSASPDKYGKKIPRQYGAGAHTDFGAITLLLQDGHAGLEVLDPVTSEFVEVNPSPSAFVFNVGDMLSFWTGGEYKSSVHRVINKAPTDRYSAAFFYDGALDCPLVPLDGSSQGTTEGGVYTVEKHMIKRISESYAAGK